MFRSQKEKTEPKDNNNTSEYGTKNPPDKLPRIVLEPASSEKATQKWDSLDEMERRLMENFSLEEDDTYRMEFDLQVLKSQIMRLRQQNRKHTHQIRKWNLNELRSELHKLSEQQELIEKAMLQDHVSLKTSRERPKSVPPFMLEISMGLSSGKFGLP